MFDDSLAKCSMTELELITAVVLLLLCDMLI